jgi:hypothetical protein
MSARSGGRTATVYEILVRGELGESLTEELGPCRLEHARGRTRIVIEILDQAHLHGVLERLRDLNIDIESVIPSTRRGVSGDPRRGP